MRGVVATDPQRRVEWLQDAIRLHPQYRSAVYQLGYVHYLDSNYQASRDSGEDSGRCVGISAGTIHDRDERVPPGEYAKAAETFSPLAPTYDVLVNLGVSRRLPGTPPRPPRAPCPRTESFRRRSGF